MINGKATILKTTSVVLFAVLFEVMPGLIFAQSQADPSLTHQHDPQHTARPAVASQPLNSVHWSTPVDTTDPAQQGGGEILAHYGAPRITERNTVVVPVRTSSGSSDVFQLKAFTSIGKLLYTLTSGYILPPHSWTPSFSAALSQGTRLYYADAGGTVSYRDPVDSPTGRTGRIAFYGNLSLYTNNAADFNEAVQISTPITSDRAGNIYFGFVVDGNPGGLGLQSGIARISSTGVGTWVSAFSATGGVDTNITHVPLNCAPALSNDQSTLYFATAYGPAGSNNNGGYLVAVRASDLSPIAHHDLIDPYTLNLAGVYSDSSASPTVGPDGDVYYGVMETPCCSHHDRGWLLHFDAGLTQVKIPGSFGWDTNASIVPAQLVPGYTGTSPYLLLTKYNNYADSGGDGVNKVALLDPFATMLDPIVGKVNVMREVMTVVGVGTPPVAEWCINTVAIDPVSKSAIVNSEDGHSYRWDFTSGLLTQSINLDRPIGEAYTPTTIGPDGQVYVINDAILYALGK
jgi:hypothetical protein